MNIWGWLMVGGLVIGLAWLLGGRTGGRDKEQGVDVGALASWLEARAMEGQGEWGMDIPHPTPSSSILSSCIGCIDSWSSYSISTYECTQWLRAMTYGMSSADQQILIHYILIEAKNKGREAEGIAISNRMNGL